MAAKQYLLAACQQLTAAMSDLQAQISSMQKQAEDQKQHLHSEYLHLEHQRNTHQIQVTQLGDDGERRAVQNRVSQLNHELDQKRAAMAQVDHDTAQLVAHKEQLHKSVLNVCGEVTQLAAQPDAN